MAPHLQQFKKRKRPNTILDLADRQANASSNGTDTSRPTAVYTPIRGRSHTLSIALPGSIIANAQSHDLKTSLAGAIARAAAVFCVDEIVVFDDKQSQVLNRGRGSPVNGSPGFPHSFSDDGCKNFGKGSYNGFGTVGSADYASYTGYSDPGFFLYHLLSYLETPPNLRKALFPLHPNLRTAGTLPSLDMPHHLRADEWCQYREGVVLDPNASDDASSWSGSHSGSSYSGSPPAPSKPSQIISLKKQKKFKKGSPPLAAFIRHSNSPPVMLDLNAGTGTAASPYTVVDAGLPQPVQLDLEKPIPPHTRVTLKLASAEDPGHYYGLEAQPVDPAQPREEAGYYWGYHTRQASSLSAVFTECPFDGGYDVSIGTSERGMPVSRILARGGVPKEDVGGGGGGKSDNGRGFTLPREFKHMILVFGGVSGLEVAAMADEDLVAKGVTGKNVGDMFDAWVNLVPNQGSRTIRCEEAVWLGLMGFSEYVRHNGERQAEMSAGQKRMVMDMQKRKAMPSMVTVQSQNLDEMPTDVGLMPDTFIRPTGINVPSLVREPRLRLKMEYHWAKTRVYDLVRRKISKLVLQLHEDMYTAFA
ncbi:putative deoxyribose-phosphate aldolase [Diplodia seriata]|uniref:Putative deoxyribose-phosphate aldolase n=1 Tax=Diplodia seriata TaxID=420778 RepID=A0A0G2F3X0_9PEZI|nr:putative deoxyribose-phosphate aldolase [Diplodia seriata]